MENHLSAHEYVFKMYIRILLIRIIRNMVWNMVEWKNIYATSIATTKVSSYDTFTTTDWHFPGDHYKEWRLIGFTYWIRLAIFHYSDVIMSTMASQITGVSIVYSPFSSGGDKKNIKAPGHWPLLGGNHRWPVNSPHKWPVTRKMFPSDDVIMLWSQFSSACDSHLNGDLRVDHWHRRSYARGWNCIAKWKPSCWIKCRVSARSYVM